MKDMEKAMKTGRLAKAASAALLAALLGGCGCESEEGSAPGPADPKAEVKERMADKKYTAALEKGIAKRGEIQKAMADAKARLDAALKDGAEAAAVEKLKGELAALRAKFDANQKAMEDRIARKLREQADASAAKQTAKQANKISK